MMFPCDAYCWSVTMERCLRWNLWSVQAYKFKYSILIGAGESDPSGSWLVSLWNANTQIGFCFP